MNNNEKVFFSLLRLGIGNEGTYCQIPNLDKDWKELFEMSQNQGCSALILDAFDKLIDSGISIDMDFQTKMDWIGSVQQMEVISHWKS